MENKDTVIVNRKLKQLVCEGIKDIYFEDFVGPDQYLHIVTKPSKEVIFGVNELGAWIKG